MIDSNCYRVITSGSAATAAVSTHKKHDVMSIGCDKNCNCNDSGATAITPIFSEFCMIAFFFFAFFY